MNIRQTLYRIIAIAVLFLLPLGVAQSQSYDLRIVHVNSGGENVDVFLDNTSPATFNNVAYEYSSTQARQLPMSGSQINLQVASAGAGIGSAFINQTFNIAASTDYTGVVYRIGVQPKLMLLARSRNKIPGPNKALVRVLNVTSLSTPGAFDFYLDSARGTPAFSGVAAESVSAWLELTGEPRTMYITEAGSKTVVAQMVIPLVAAGRLTLIVTGTSSSELKVHALAGEMVDGHKMPLLKGVQGGALSSLRVVHAWWQQKTSGKGLQALDIFLNDGVQPRTTDLRYRSASEKYGPFTENEVTVKFALVNEGASSAVFQQTIPLNRDTDYVSILTKSRQGAAAGLTLGTPSIITTLDSFFVRAAYVTDFHSDVIVKIIPEGREAIVLPPVQFLTATQWYSLPRGPFTVTAEKPNEASPFYTKNEPGNTQAGYYTVMVLGSEQTFEIDILNEGLPVRQVFDPASSVPVTPGMPGLALHAVPNPSNGSAMVQFHLDRPAQGTLTLHDPLGRAVATLSDGLFTAGSNTVHADLASLPQGMYFIRLRTESGVQGMGRMVVEK